MAVATQGIGSKLMDFLLEMQPALLTTLGTFQKLEDT